jgi:serine/threonine protein kinase
MKTTGALGESEVKDIVQAIAVALKYCHEIGVAHRDIKTDNVLVGPVCYNQEQLAPEERFQMPDQASTFLKGKQIMLIDFAFATSCLGAKKVETYCGTTSYMSPEIIRKEAHCPKKADVWALGIVAFRLLTGEHPFAMKPDEPAPPQPPAEEGQEAVAEPEPDPQAEEPAPIISGTLEERIVNEDFRREKLKGFGRSLNNFMDRCLEKNPDKRSAIRDLLLDSWIKATYTSVH